MNKEEALNFLIKDSYTPNISDGFHNFQELYDHRHALFIALCRKTQEANERGGLPEGYIWRSLKHSDGTQYKEWFILGIGLAPGKQITYHLPYSLWEETNFCVTLETAPPWDKHSGQDVLDRLKNL